MRLLNHRFVPYLFFSLVALCLFLPVLLVPHWGLFSDAFQIIGLGRDFWPDPWQRLDLVRGYWRPAFHAQDLLIYRLFGENPFYFYLVQYGFFTGILIVTYLNCLLLSNSVRLSLLFTSVFFVSSSTFEVLYTLDKGEPRIAFWFGLIFWLYMSVDRTLSRTEGADSVRKFKNFKGAIGWIIAALTLAFFTKETSRILLLEVCLLYPLLISLRVGANAPHLFSWKRLMSELKASVRDPRIVWLFTFGLAIILVYLAYNVFFNVTGGPASAGYLKLELSVQGTLSSLAYYKQFIPDVYVLLGYCLIAALLMVTVAKKLVRSSRFEQLEFGLFHALNLTLLALVYLLALVNFRLKLIYIWFPIYTLLLPASCYYTACLFQRLKPAFKKWGMLALLGVLLISIPSKILDAQIVYGIDALKDDVIEALVAYRAKTNEKMVLTLPFQVAESTEIGERLEFFAYDKLFRQSPVPEAEKLSRIQFFNYLSYVPANPFFPVSSTVALQATAKNTQPDLDRPPAPVGIRMFAFKDSESFWTESTLTPGTYLLVPYGTLPPGKFQFRGTDLFSYSVQQKLAFMPQIQVEPVLQVEHPVRMFGQTPAIMGWQVLKVTAGPPIAWNLYVDGWLPGKTEIFYAKPLLNASLTLRGISNVSPGERVVLRCEGADAQPLAVPERSAQAVNLTIPLRCQRPTTDPHIYAVHIEKQGPTQPQPNNPDPRDLFFLVQSVGVSHPTSVLSP